MKSERDYLWRQLDARPDALPHPGDASLTGDHLARALAACLEAARHCGDDLARDVLLKAGALLVGQLAVRLEPWEAWRGPPTPLPAAPAPRQDANDPLAGPPEPRAGVEPQRGA